MSDDIFGDDPFAASSANRGESTASKPITNVDLDAKASMLLAKRADYVILASSFRDFWMRVDVMGPVERDQWIQHLYAQYLLLAPHLGVSLMGLPQLRECCGQRRETVNALLADPSKTLFGTPAILQAPPVEELAWWPGDIIRRITRFFGVEYCEACDQRRRWINSWFGKKY